MKLSEAELDSRNPLLKGFVDLGEQDSVGQRIGRSDHALLLFFQPFAGRYVQTLGAFLSHGCASSGALHTLILESVVLMENAGFSVDVISSNGLTLNRTLRKLFWLSYTDNSCPHPCSEGENDRRLYFCSDFHRLIENFRGFLVSTPEIWVRNILVSASARLYKSRNEKSIVCSFQYRLRVAW